MHTHSAVTKFPLRTTNLHDILRVVVWMTEMVEPELALQHFILPVDPVRGLNVDTHCKAFLPEFSQNFRRGRDEAHRGSAGSRK